MSRWISLIVLLAVIAVTGTVLYRVMAAFLLPLFLASVLAVIFRPLHLRIVKRWPRKPATAALLTTALILLTVLLPLAGIATLAIREGLGAIGGDVLDRAEVRIARLRESMELELPFPELPGAEGEDEDVMSLNELDQLVQTLPVSLPEFEDASNTRELQRHLDELFVGLERLNHRLQDTANVAIQDTDDSDDASDLRRVKRLIDNDSGAFQSLHEMTVTVGLAGQYLKLGPQVFPSPGSLELVDDVANAAERRDDEPSVSGEPGDESDEISVAELRRRFRRLQPGFAAFRIDLLGGPFWSWLTDLLNPTTVQLDSLRANIQRSLRNLLPSVAGQATAIVGGSLLGLAIMSLSVFYFLKDGPAMMQSLMKLSPLDDRYEQELMTEFEAVSRAVVLATLLSAVAQAVLAGIAYFFAGFNSVFLLTTLTFIFAMVPFIGGAAVWFPACLWLAAVEERLWAAAMLGIYCITVVSMADNVIKPYILHGHSNLHPLLALLSVLGGVQALGPIGILVGPMVVCFLQALLNILNNELKNLDKAAS